MTVYDGFVIFSVTIAVVFGVGLAVNILTEEKNE